MKLTSLANLLSGKLSANDFSAEIAEELSEHTRGVQRLGGSAPVVVTQDMNLILDRPGLSTLCRLFASGQLSAGELAYTVDAMQLSEGVEFADSAIADHLDECTDPENNGPLTVSRALEIAGYGNAA